MGRMQVLAEIDSLVDNYDKLTAKERKKADKQLEELGEMLLKPKQDKLQKLLKKGRELSYTEVKYLMEQGVTKERVRKAMRINFNTLDEFIKKHGRNKVMAKTSEKPNIKEESKDTSLVISREKYNQLLDRYTKKQREWEEKESQFQDQIQSLSEPMEEVNHEQNNKAHKEVCKTLNSIYQKKNADYGNSFSEQFEEHGITSSVIRLDDKMRRVKQLVKSESNVKDESIEDTLMDLANYSIMTLMELRANE